MTTNEERIEVLESQVRQLMEMASKDFIHDTIRSKKVEIVGDEGARAGLLLASETGGQMALFDDREKVAACLGVDSDGGLVLLKNAMTKSLHQSVRMKTAESCALATMKAAKSVESDQIQMVAA